MASCLEFEGKAVEDAVRQASETLNIPKGKLKYTIISHGSTGIFGLVGVKKARISVTLPKGEEGRSGSRPARKDRMEDIDAETAASVSSLVREAFNLGEEEEDTAEEPPRRAENPPRKKEPEKTHEKPANSRRRRRPDRAREKAPAGPREKSVEKPAPAAVEEAAEPLPEAVPDTPPEPARPISAEDIEQAVTVGRTVLQRIIDFITTDATISVAQMEDRILFNVAGGNAGVLIGKRGQTLEAIQYLVEKIVNKHNDDRIRIQIDVEGYLDNRRTSLEELARRLAEKTRTTGRPSTMGQMNAHDRRIVHLTLKDDSAVRTQSIGDGFYRKLVIFPKKSNPRRKRPAR